MSHFAFTLPNGLTLIGEANPQMASVTVAFCVRTGSRDEPTPLEGISHFLEHMCFKGTERYSAAELNLAFDRLGAQSNAFTGREYTLYYARVLPEHTAEAVELLADMMRPALRPEEIELEKGVILEEIAMYLDQPEERLYMEAMQAHYGAHSMGHPILGTGESVSALTRPMVVAYHTARYSPHNITCCLVGALDRPGPELLSLIAEHCGEWAGEPAERVHAAFAPGGKNRTIVDADVAHQHIAMVSPAPPMLKEGATYAFDVLTTLLGDDRNSRLYWALVDPGLCDEATTTYLPGDGVGSVYTYLRCDPEDAEEVVRRAHRVLSGADGGMDDDLIGARNKLLTEQVLQGERSIDRCISLGMDRLYGRPYRTLDAELAALEGVDGPALADALAHWPLLPGTLVSLGPRADLAAVSLT